MTFSIPPFLKRFSVSLYNFYIDPKKGIWITYFLVLTVLCLGIATYFSVRRQSDLNQGNMSNFGLLYANLIFLIGMLIIIGKRWASVAKKQKTNFPAFKLRRQIVTLFGVVTLLPGLLVAIFASLFFNLGVQSWFGEPVKNALLESDAVIKAYLKEHERNLGLEAQKIAAYLSPKFEILKNDREALDNELSELENTFIFNEAMILTSKQQILGKSQLTFSLEFSKLKDADFKKAKSTGFLTHIDKNQLRALVLIDETEGIYLYIGKSVDKKILNHKRHHHDAVSLYNNLERQRSGFEFTFLIIFSLISLLLLFAAIWVGLNIANRMINPISKLVHAAKTVSEGDLNVHIDHQHFNNELDTLVHSFNVMTRQLKKQQDELILTQKKATWSDIARKIAHEIKNPLTPIQLSAERLKRRYLRQISDGSETFEQCINTIIRQVQHIESLVREFSNFARMPEASMKNNNIVTFIKECISLEESAHPTIHFNRDFRVESLYFYCDPQQIFQALTNLLQNSVNALIENEIEDPTIYILLQVTEENILIMIADNGIGFSKIGREKLTEPYYTTREKGTGLGLAIVEKIVTDHGGTISFEDRPNGGAVVKLNFIKKV